MFLYNKLWERSTLAGQKWSTLPENILSQCTGYSYGSSDQLSICSSTLHQPAQAIDPLARVSAAVVSVASLHVNLPDAQKLSMLDIETSGMAKGTALMVKGQLAAPVCKACQQRTINFLFSKEQLCCSVMH